MTSPFAARQQAHTRVTKAQARPSDHPSARERLLATLQGTAGNSAVAGLARRWHGSARSSPSARPIQAIMALADFQAATPSGFMKPRSTVTMIDQALNTYIRARTGANAAALIGVIQNYAGGNHDAARILVARELLQRADAERRLLQVIGDNNAFLVDALIEQADIARIDQLVQLATDATAPNAALLPNLINAVGQANIYNLNASGLVTATGAAHVPLLTTMIAQSGGFAQRANLAAILGRHPGQGDLAFDLTREAAGSAPDFQRLAAEVPRFNAALVAPPPAPAAVQNAVNAYNAAILPSLVAALTNLANEAQAAVNAAVAMGGVAPGLINNVNARIAAVNARLVALAAPGAVGSPADAAAALAARNIVDNALRPAVTNRAGVLAIPVPAAFTANVVNVIAANDAAAGAAVAPAVANVSFGHFLSRHTAHYFNFAKIKTDNTQWDPALGAAADNHVANQFAAVLTGLSAAGNWLQPGVAAPNQACPGGGTAQIAGLAAPGNQINVGQFFPDPPAHGANIYAHPDSTMRAIRKVL